MWAWLLMGVLVGIGIMAVSRLFGNTFRNIPGGGCGCLMVILGLGIAAYALGILSL